MSMLVYQLFSLFSYGVDKTKKPWKIVIIQVLQISCLAFNDLTFLFNEIVSIQVKHF